MLTYSDLQLDALGELANIGSGTAAGALSAMIGLPVDVSVPSAQALALADAADAVGSAEPLVSAVALPVVGDLAGVVLMLVADEDAARLCSLLGVEAGTDLGRSALSEVANVVGASYLGALGTTMGVEIEPGPPLAASDALGAVATADVALLLDSRLTVEGVGAAVSFLLVPDRDSVRDLLARLGID
jgi:chemotaxis protein CheC